MQRQSAPIAKRAAPQLPTTTTTTHTSLARYTKSIIKSVIGFTSTVSALEGIVALLKAYGMSAVDNAVFSLFDTVPPGLLSALGMSIACLLLSKQNRAMQTQITNEVDWWTAKRSLRFAIHPGSEPYQIRDGEIAILLSVTNISPRRWVVEGMMATVTAKGTKVTHQVETRECEPTPRDDDMQGKSVFRITVTGLQAIAATTPKPGDVWIALHSVSFKCVSDTGERTTLELASTEPIGVLTRFAEPVTG